MEIETEKGKKEKNVTEENKSIEIELMEKKQKELQKNLDLTDFLENSGRSTDSIKLIGGTDISFDPYDSQNRRACAEFTICEYPSMKLILAAYSYVEINMPYISGFLGFRECPPLVDLINDTLKSHPILKPDVILVDGNGILHPREFGSACLLGIQLDIPTIGVSKKLTKLPHQTSDDIKLIHSECKTKLKQIGDYFEIKNSKNIPIGAIYRGPSKKHIYISPGYKINLQNAIKIVGNSTKYRIPEPIRIADLDTRNHIRNISLDKLNEINNLHKQINIDQYFSDDGELDLID